jgi:MraZ protein
MFLGDYQHTLDAKGRVSLPAKFRNEMTGKLVIAKGFDTCLAVYSVAEWEKFTEVILSRADFDPDVRQLRRQLTSGSNEVELDSAGRVSLPQNLREWAGLKKDVAVIGNGNRIEIWDSEKWAEYNGESASMEELASKLSSTGML